MNVSFYTLFKKISYVADKIFYLFFFQKDIWRRMNFEGSSLPPVYDQHFALYIRRVEHVLRVQEIRWFHDQAMDDNSPLYTEANLRDLLDRLHDSFNRIAEN